jgi:hypothetical protein
MGMPSESGLAVALDLLETSVEFRAQRHRREHPEATESEVASVVQAWLLDRPGAPDGDAPGRRRPLTGS